MVNTPCTELLNEDLRSVHVEASAHNSRWYLYRAGDSEEDIDDFGVGEYGEEMFEYDFRHPGTSYDSDDEDLRGENEIFSLINTKAECFALAFAGAAPVLYYWSFWEISRESQSKWKRDCFLEIALFWPKGLAREVVVGLGEERYQQFSGLCQHLKTRPKPENWFNKTKVTHSPYQRSVSHDMSLRWAMVRLLQPFTGRRSRNNRKCVEKKRI